MARLQHAARRSQICCGNCEPNIAGCAQKNVRARRARAPQRARFPLVRPDLRLARELFEQGEKETVVEYLRLWEFFKNVETKTLKRWQTEIKLGKTPSFNESEL